MQGPSQRMGVTEIASAELMLGAGERLAALYRKTAFGLLLRERLLRMVRGKRDVSTVETIVGEESLYARDSLSVARESRQRAIVYAIGVPDGKGGYGMTHGPMPGYWSLLKENVEDGSVLIRFDSQGETILYRYHEKAGGWH